MVIPTLQYPPSPYIPRAAANEEIELPSYNESQRLYENRPAGSQPKQPPTAAPAPVAQQAARQPARLQPSQRAQQQQQQSAAQRAAQQQRAVVRRNFHRTYYLRPIVYYAAVSVGVLVILAAITGCILLFLWMIEVFPGNNEDGNEYRKRDILPLVGGGLDGRWVEFRG